MKKYIILLFLSYHHAATADALLDVFKKALKKDPTYLSATANNLASQERVKQAKSFMYPKISSNVSQRKTITDRLDFKENKISLTIAQPLYNKKTQHGLKQSKYAAQSATVLLTQAKQDLLLRVARTYFDVLQAKDSLKSAQSESKAIQSQLRTIKQQFKVGTLTLSDVSEAQARKDSATFSALSATNKLRIEQEKLREIIGVIPAFLRPLKSKFPLLVPAPANEEAWVRKALKHSPLLHSQQNLTRAAKEEINIQRAGHYPSLNLVGSISRKNDTIPGSSETNNKTIGLELDIPIFQGGYVRSRTREAGHKFTASKATLDKTRRQIQRNARELYGTIVSDIKRIRAAEQLLRSTRTSLQVAEESFEAGIRTTLDILNARSAMFKAKLSLSQSRYQYLYHTLQLKAVAGVLTEKSLRKVNALLQ